MYDKHSDTHELSKKWRAELDEGISPLTDWAGAPKVGKKKQKVPSSNQADDHSAPVTTTTHPESSASSSSQGPPQPTGPLADAQAAMARNMSSSSSSFDESFPAGFTEPSRTASSPVVEEIPEDGPKPILDIDDPESQKKANANQVVIGTAPQ